jgi:5'-nucleotidase
MRNLIIINILLVLILQSCSQDYNIKTTDFQLIEVSNEVDSNIIKIISPYKSQLDIEMNEVICYTKSELKKGKPESKLGNFVCDLSMSITNGTADVCVFNNGGLRDIISKGDITIRDIYKVMPFENELVILDLNKNEFYDLLKYIIKRGGEPIGGLSIVEKKDTILSSFNNDSIIRVLTTDYLANGGDKMKFFNNKEQKKVGIKLRDAIIQFCKESDTLRIQLDNRITIVENDK